MSKKVLILLISTLFYNSFGYSQESSKELLQSKLTSKSALSEASKYIESFKYKKALDVLNTAYDQGDTTLKAMYLKGVCCSKLGLQTEAVRHFEDLLSLDSTHVLSWNQLAALKKNRGNHRESFVCYQKMIELDTANSYFYQQAGDAALRLHDPMSAEDYYLSALHYNPRDVNSAASLSQIYLSAEDYTKADSITLQGLQYDPANKKLLLKLIKSYYHQKKDYEGLLKATYLYSIDSSNVALQNYLSIFYYRVKKYEESIYWSNRVIDQQKGQESNYFYLGLAYAALKEYEIAEKAFNVAIFLGQSENLKHYYTQLGSIYDEQGRYTESIQAYRKSREFGSDANVIYKLATLYEKHYADQQPALEWYKKYEREKDLTKDTALNKFIDWKIQRLNEKVHFQQK